jgi:hypothetical protein
LTKPGDVPISGQHMLQEAVDELFHGEGAQFELTCVSGIVAKGHRRNRFRLVLQLDQAAVADGNAEDIGARY